MAEIAPIRTLDEAAALDWLRSQPGGRTNLPAAELSRRWGWHRQRAGRRLKAWAKAGLITRRGNTVRVASGTPQKAPRQHVTNNSQRLDDASESFDAVTPLVVAPDAATGSVARHAIDVLAYTAAIGLASVAALFSIRGMVTLFPGAPLLIIAMASMMEASKLIAAGWLARRWRLTAWIWRLVLVALVAGLALINATGVYAQLVAAHVGERGAAQSVIETQAAGLEARIERQAHIIADIDARVSQIDAAIAEATKRGRTSTALSVMEAQKKARAGLASERNEAAGTLAALKAERATVVARSRQIETEAAPIRYVAELVGADTDSERAIRWLIMLIVLCCDPLAIALTAAASARGVQS